MATYNGAQYLREQLDSILSQLHPEDELIVSDDCSVDETRAIVASYRNPQIRLIANPRNRGHVKNFAYAMAHATGEFIALSDQDDIWVETRLERMLDQLDRTPRCSLVIGDVIEFDNQGVRPFQTPLGPSPHSRFIQMARIFLGRSKYFGCAFLFRRELMRYILPIPPVIEAHDIWIGMNACLRNRITHLQEAVVMRRLHEGNLTPLQSRGLSKVMKSRMNYIIGLIQTSLR
jgi:glycosyltransferase involved in cell wall biosynthesis